MTPWESVGKLSLFLSVRAAQRRRSVPLRHRRRRRPRCPPQRGRDHIVDLPDRDLQRPLSRRRQAIARVPASSATAAAAARKPRRRSPLPSCELPRFRHEDCLHGESELLTRHAEAWAAESKDGGGGPEDKGFRQQRDAPSFTSAARSVGHKPSSSHAPGAPGSFTGESICMSVIQRSPGRPGRALDLALDPSRIRASLSLGRAESGLISFSLGCFLKCGLVQTSLLSPGISYALLSFLAA